MNDKTMEDVRDPSLEQNQSSTGDKTMEDVQNPPSGEAARSAQGARRTIVPAEQRPVRADEEKYDDEDDEEMENLSASSDDLPTHSDNDTLVIYVDASVGRHNDERHTGIAAVVSLPIGGWEYVGMCIPGPRGPGQNCSTCPEMKALDFALSIVIERFPGFSSLVIFTDCARAIARFHDLLESEPHDKTFDSRRVPVDAKYEVRPGVSPSEYNHQDPYFDGDWAITQGNLDKIMYINIRMQMHVQVVWVPSHCGIEGNERADTLAKYARLEGQRDRERGHVPAYWKIWRGYDPTIAGPYNDDSGYQMRRMRTLNWHISPSRLPYEDLAPRGWLQGIISDWNFYEGPARRA